MAVSSTDFKPLRRHEHNAARPAGPRSVLPACIWSLRCGRQILVGADNVPMWERAAPGKPAKRADPNEFLVGIVDRDPIYPKSTSPQADPAVMRRVLAVLAQWKIDQ